MRSAAWLLPAVLLVWGCGDTGGVSLGDPEPAHPDPIITVYTVRLPASDPEEQTISLAQAVYGATREENAPGAIIVCPRDARLAFTAMNRITHMPINAPLLYLTDAGELSEEVKREMKRLRPEGVTQDGNVQVYTVGEVAPEVIREIEDDLKYKVRSFSVADPVLLAELLDRWQAALKANHMDEVLVASVDHPEGMLHALGAMGWNAHMGQGFAWVERGTVPDATREILERRFGDDGAYIYVAGPRDVISDEVVIELSKYGLVRRIAGENVYASNTVNAGYKDFGRNFGWWWGWVPRDFGWGISQAGHNVTIVGEGDLLGAIPSALLGHMGKHGPMLIVKRDEVPQAVKDYLEMIRPFESGPTETIRNFAWIIGGESSISWEVQKEIDRLLRPAGVVFGSPPESPTAALMSQERGQW